jgi:DNA-binding SARP family transcriptional activator
VLFQVLGPLRVNRADGQAVELVDSDHQRVLCTLLLRPNEWVSTESLAEAVWPDRPLVSPQAALWACVHTLRRLTPLFDGTCARIDSRFGRHRINIAEGELDSALFEGLIDEGWSALPTDAEFAAACFRDSVDLWRGVPFAELHTYHSRFEAARLTRLRWAALDGLVDALLAAGHFADSVTLLHALTAQEPAREHTWLRLIEVLNQIGRPVEAAAAYRKAVRTVGLR